MSLPLRTVLIVSEKPYASARIETAWKAVHPNDFILHVYTPPMGLFGVAVEDTLPWDALPLVRDVSQTRRLRTNVGLASQTDVPTAVQYADVLVCATDPDPQGARNFYALLEVYPTHAHTTVPWIRLESTDPVAIEQAIRANLTTDHPDFQAYARAGQARHHFHHTYTINAAHVFKPCLQAVGVPGPWPYLSKYALQLLLYLATTPPHTEGDILRMMSTNRGTGVFGDSPLGSPISNHEALTALRKTGLVARSPQPPHPWSVSERGHAFLAMVHPGLRDPDMAGRLHVWQDTWPHSKPSMDAYLRAFFERQKAHMESLGLAPTPHPSPSKHDHEAAHDHHR